MAQVEIPLTSREVALQTSQEYAASPEQFIRGMIPQLEQDNPRYLDGSLSGAVLVATQEYPEPAQKILGGSFFRFACTDRELRKKGEKLPDLASSFERTLEEVARLTGGALRAGSEIGVIARQMAMRIERDDPEVGKIVRALVEQPIATFRIENIVAFVQGVHDAHLNIIFLKTESILPAMNVVEPSPSPLPVVSRSIVRRGLLETVLDPDEFILKTIDEVDKLAPGMVDRIMRTATSGVPNPDRYLLLASFEIFCFMQEFHQRQRPFPAISRQDPVRHPNPEIDRLIRTGDDNEMLDEMLAKYRNSILDEIEKTNPHLSWGISRLLYPLAMMGPEYLSTAVNGIVNQYSTLKSASRI